VRLRLTEAARDDLRTVYMFYMGRSPAAADRAVGAILKAANGLARYPLMGKPGAIGGTRERVIMRFPYRVVYQIEEDDIVVLRIIHTARQWP
jgi:toxin ParE1/3/4